MIRFLFILICLLPLKGYSQDITTWNYVYGSMIIKDASYYRYMEEVAQRNYQYRKSKGEEAFGRAIDYYNKGEYKDALYVLKTLHFIDLRPQVHKLRTYCYLKTGKCGKAKHETNMIKQYNYELWKQVTKEIKNVCG